MTEELKIDDDVPLPRRNSLDGPRAGRPVKFPALEKILPGQSFVYPGTPGAAESWLTRMRRRNPGTKWTMRSDMDKKETRIWRLE